jgi:hypothetical protein
MTSFYPATARNYATLKASPPPGFAVIKSEYEGTHYERFWLGKEGIRPFRVMRDSAHGIEVTRFGLSDAREALQLVANHLGCALVSEYVSERFEPLTPPAV